MQLQLGAACTHAQSPALMVCTPAPASWGAVNLKRTRPPRVRCRASHRAHSRLPWLYAGIRAWPRRRRFTWPATRWAPKSRVCCTPARRSLAVGERALWGARGYTPVWPPACMHACGRVCARARARGCRL
ncbi:hypothetical protein EON67_05380 [archaeon]|nr:MAG: hypothetical protein EON67_05380 [archaeon]